MTPPKLAKQSDLWYDERMQFEAIEESLGYKFTDTAWLKQALSHPSSDQKKKTNLNYERLEFLGDAVLELVVSRELFSLFPKADEGTLTKLRSGIVSRQHLAGLCEKLGWGEYILMSPQLEKTGGRRAVSVLANTFESVIGAVMMDSNYNAVRKVALHLMAESLAGAENYLEINYKGKLLEILQAIDGTGPEYVVEPVNPAQPAGPFHARAVWHDRVIGEAEAPSKHRAQVASAQNALSLRLWEQE
ncbi:MAG: ribonuclease III [Akkermansia sp.]|nr:ribonuclease III [Akkermansia sp.]